MQALNIALFQSLGAGYAPHPGLLWFASEVATGASWLCVAIMGWAAWRLPPQRAWVMVTLVGAAAASVVSHALAAALDMPRPFTMGLTPSHIEHGARGSLPSTHASVMFTTALIFMMRTPLRNLGLAMLAIAALTGWARVYVGVHFPLDIAAGFVVAMGISGALWALQQLSQRFIEPLIARDDMRTRAGRLAPPGNE